MPLGSLIGGMISQGGANAAGDKASAAGAEALKNSTDVANRDVARLSPWQASGAAAAQQINALLGLGKLGAIGDQYNTYGTSADPNAQKEAAAQFQTDPGYQFRLQQGTNALDRSGAARGMTLSGAQAKGLNDYGQGMASSEYGNYFNRLMGVSGQGMTAAGGANSAYNQAMLPGIAQNYGGQIQAGNDYMAGSNALAAGIKGAAQSAMSLGSFGLSGGFSGLGGSSGAPGQVNTGVGRTASGNWFG